MTGSVVHELFDALVADLSIAPNTLLFHALASLDARCTKGGGSLELPMLKEAGAA
jgi:hypothetical protein